MTALASQQARRSGLDIPGHPEGSGTDGADSPGPDLPAGRPPHRRCRLPPDRQPPLHRSRHRRGAGLHRPHRPDPDARETGDPGPRGQSGAGRRRVVPALSLDGPQGHRDSRRSGHRDPRRLHGPQRPQHADPAGAGPGDGPARRPRSGRRRLDRSDRHRLRRHPALPALRQPLRRRYRHPDPDLHHAGLGA